MESVYTYFKLKNQKSKTKSPEQAIRAGFEQLNIYELALYAVDLFE